MNAPALNEQRVTDADPVASAQQQVMAAGQFAAARGWVPATSGNFSARVDADRIVVTRSGADKGALTPADLAVVNLREPLPPGLSAEAPLHVARYLADASIGAIFHVHSPAAALASRRNARHGVLTLEGWELQKAFAGVTSHLAVLNVPVFANSQDTVALAAEVEARLQNQADLAPGYLLAGHGLYAWGRTGRETLRHLEAFDVLLQLQLEWERNPL
ncbi:methylthioribulose 1-phosphate dehydratase [Amantichitinum ursilacus]|uniref:Methylthioribulose-1-phosphate dehydratase n=1 Tax=Amantichitinum ursilacus TaxID=857265 RepID=A0A0N0GM43_9NEIS|nr:methylthioribulose 1-phosphate dehydratase [Amantichitinum ursilacus]KPC50724.1 Methylthioribulose-1-phosphate dehydratase [Amantichitinum ursilacus]